MIKNQRIEVIDLLRGLSCLGVLLFHVRIDLWIGWWRITSYPQEYSSFAKAMAWLSIPTPFLGYAILLFFLISGFCIHYPNACLSKKPCWKTYFKRRFWRIYPTYFVAVLLTAVISYSCYSKWGDLTWNLDRIVRVLALSQNYPPSNGQFLSNPSLWTIPLEIEFYILYPVAFFLFLRIKFPSLFLLSMCLSFFSVYLSKQGIKWVSFTFLFLWPSWLLGTWIAQMYCENKITKLNSLCTASLLLVSLIIALHSRLENWESWIQYSCWCCFYFFLFIFFLRLEKVIFQARDSMIYKSITFLGKISFSLYLIHFPLFKLFGYLHVELFNHKPANFFVTLTYLIPVIFISWIFFTFIELPIHNWSKKSNPAK